MKNKKQQIGDWYIQVPELVFKLAFVYDDYKAPQRLKLWAEAERKVKDQLLPYGGPGSMFHEEKRVDGKIVYEFRYYTMPTNRSKTLTFPKPLTCSKS